MAPVVSRRRDPRAQRYQVRVVCTDRGQHPRAEIAVLLDQRHAASNEQIQASRQRVAHVLGRDLDLGELPPDEVRRAIQARGTSHRATGDRWTTIERAPVFEPTPHGSRKTRFRCPRCGRDVPLSEASLGRLVDGLYAAYPTRRAHQFDISHMPANLT